MLHDFRSEQPWNVVRQSDLYLTRSITSGSCMSQPRREDHGPPTTAFPSSGRSMAICSVSTLLHVILYISTFMHTS